jgi:hypothetical protein
VRAQFKSGIESATSFARLGSLFFTSVAAACPLCHTQTGEQVRAGIFNSNFGLNLMAMALPFVVFVGVVAWLHRGGNHRP